MAIAEPVALLSSKQVGNRLGLSPDRVRALRREGRIRPAVRYADGYLFSSAAVETYQRERQEPQVVVAEPAPSRVAREEEAPDVSVESEPTQLQTRVADFLNSAAHTPPSTTFEDHQP